MQVRANGFDIASGQVADVSGLETFGSKINGFAAFHHNRIGMMKTPIIQVINVALGKGQFNHGFVLEKRKKGTKTKELY